MRLLHDIAVTIGIPRRRLESTETTKSLQDRSA
jgi:hypothetical protein